MKCYNTRCEHYGIDGCCLTINKPELEVGPDGVVRCDSYRLEEKQ
jgi:hypothetical protein